LFTQPLFDSEQQLLAVVPERLRHSVRVEPTFVHVLTHKDLHLHACHLVLPEKIALGEGGWFSAAQWPVMGLPAPVRKLLEPR
jgi:A/G-specific adenine glycosylase